MATSHQMLQENYHVSDFTIAHYQTLLQLAKQHYRFITYDQIDLQRKFILWRHDCDFSLNRSLRLAELEYQAGISSTFFINPHSEFYNFAEKKQSQLIRQIMALGHKIGLHFDADYHAVSSENQLDTLVETEARWLSNVFDTDIVAFSFHNPTSFLLSCDHEKYGGLINCYSSFFKAHVPFCSDSNGYWRFRRLHDVLDSASDRCLQVLTHPGWWQETPMLPRKRIQRCADGRAQALMQDYDNLLIQHGRKNIQ